MTWTRDSSSGVITHAGSVRSFWLLTEDPPERGEFRAGLVDTAHGVRVAVRASGDGATAFYVGIDGANLTIEEWRFGALVQVRASVAHGIAGGTVFRLRVRDDGETIEAWAGITESSEVSISHGTRTYRSYRRVGVVSAVDGAVVSWFEVGSVSDSISTLAEVGVVLIGGNLYRSLQDGIWERVAENVFPASSRVSMAALGGEMIMVGAGLAKRYRPVPNTVDNYVPTVGELPGQTDPGTTTATLVVEHLGGLVFAGMAESSIEIIGTAIDNAYDLDFSSLLAGRAYSRITGGNATSGDAIIALGKGPANSLFIGCTNSVNYLLGNPYLVADEMISRSDTVGVSGKGSVLRVAGPGGEDLQLIHSPEGLHVVPIGGAPAHVSAVLTRFLNFDRRQRSQYEVTLLRDPARRWLFVFIDSGSAAGSTHLVYDEDTAGYRQGSPGFYPIKLPVRIVAGALIRGVPIFGTADGRLVRFEDSATTDLGQPIESRVTMALLDMPPAGNDTILTKPQLVLGTGSSPVQLTLYGAATAQGVYSSGVRRFIARAVHAVRQWPASIRGRAPYLVLVAETLAAGARMVLEECHAVITSARMSSTGWVDQAAPGTPCSPSDYTGTTSGGPTRDDPPPPNPPGGGPDNPVEIPDPVRVAWPLAEWDARTSEIDAAVGITTTQMRYFPASRFDPGWRPEGGDWPGVPKPLMPSWIVPSSVLRTDPDRPVVVTTEPPPDPNNSTIVVED